MKIDDTVILEMDKQAWMSRSSDAELIYPYCQNPEQALLRIWACKIGNYLTTGITPYAIVLNSNEDWVREAAAVLSNTQVNTSVNLDGEKFTVDSTLITELYAALIEFIVVIEVGDMLSKYPLPRLH